MEIKVTTTRNIMVPAVLSDVACEEICDVITDHALCDETSCDECAFGNADIYKTFSDEVNK